MTTTSFVPQEPAAPHDIDPVVLIDEKAEYSPAEPELVSAYANLTKVQAVKYFWKATGLCFLAGLCVFMEGYQAQITGKLTFSPDSAVVDKSGNAVSNTGFIDQFGTMQPSGKLALDAKYVSAWGGTVSHWSSAGASADAVAVWRLPAVGATLQHLSRRQTWTSRLLLGRKCPHRHCKRLCSSSHRSTGLT